MLPKLSFRDVLLTAIVFVLFGVYVPYRRGFDFFDTLLLVPYLCISFLFCAPMVIDSIYANRGGKVTLQPIVRGVAYGWLCGVSIVLVGIATVNLTQHMPRVVYPPAGVLLSGLVLSLLGCGLVAGLGTFISFREDTAQDAKRKIRTGFLALLCMAWFLPGWLPAEWQDAIALQLTSDNMARNTLLAAPILLVGDVWILTKVLGRVHPGEQNRLKIG